MTDYMKEHRDLKQKQLRKKIEVDLHFRSRNPLHEQVLKVEEVVELCEKARSELIYKIRVGVLGRRDACLIAMLYAFGKRIMEVLRLKRGDIWWDSKFIYVRFRVEKKKKRDKLRCLSCNTITSASSRYCRSCGVDLKEHGQIIPAKKEINVYRKKRLLTYPLVPFIFRWVEKVPEGRYVFAPAKTGFLWSKKIEFDFTHHINRVRAWCIIDGYDVENSPHFFRHSLATNLAEDGFDDLELCDWFDWESVQMAKGYTKRAGTKRADKIARSSV